MRHLLAIGSVRDILNAIVRYIDDDFNGDINGDSDGDIYDDIDGDIDGDINGDIYIYIWRY